MRYLCLSLVIMLGLTCKSQAETTKTYDIVVYGGTCSGITAAIQAKRMGKSVILVCPEEHLGGLTISGLGWTDTKDTGCIGGMAREFYHRIWQYYKDPQAWVHQSRDSYNPSWQAGPAVQDDSETMWTFEPHVAEKVFQQWLNEAGVTVVRNRWLDRSEGGVSKEGSRITQIKTLSYDEDFGFSPAETYVGKMFIDASYEGDLMASSGVSYRIGRDSRSEYNETLNGIYFKSSDLSPSNSPYHGIDPYVVPGDPSSGFIPQIEGEFKDMSQIGKADDRLQAFNFRMTLTDVSSNRVPVPKPAGYDEKDYELLFRLYEAGQNPGFTTQRMPNLKTDNNNSGLMSLDWPGGNFSIADDWVYSEASYVERMNYVQRQRSYQQGLLWTMLYHPRVPQNIRNSRAKWGLSKDEYTDNENWPYFSYVREARRMEGEMVMTEHHVKMASGYAVTDSIGQGSYSLDSHVVRRVVIDDTIWDEGGFYVWWDDGYPISYRAILPQQQQASNLLVPVCLSASHAAFGSIRMEPTYMTLGQSAATAASIAIDHDYDVQNVPYGVLRTQLLCDGQRLKGAYSSQYPSLLLNFGAVIADDGNSPAHEIGKIDGLHWNLITGDKSSGLVTAQGTSSSVKVDLGKTSSYQKTVQWDLHGFANSSLGADFNTGVYAGNARSATYVNDGSGSHVALGVRLSGLDAGIYSLYTTAINTNTMDDDSFKIYAFEVDPVSGNTDFSSKSAVIMDNTRETGSWLFNRNFAVSTVSLGKTKDLVVVVEGLSDAGYRAFLNTLEIVQVGASPLAPTVTKQPQDVAVASEDVAQLTCGFKSSTTPTVQWFKDIESGGDQELDQLNTNNLQVDLDYNSTAGEYESSLVFSNADQTINGRYYCVIQNSDGESFSKQADILVKEKLAHWTLNASDYTGTRYTDTSGNGHPVTVSGSPSFVTGSDGKNDGAVLLTSTNGSGTAGTWNPSEAAGQMSISAWVYWTGGNETSIIADKSNAWDSSQMMWTLGINPSTERINFVSAGSTNFQTPISSAGFAQNNWHHLVVTHDARNNVAQLYVDTRLINSGSLQMGSGKSATLRLGTDANGRHFSGKLDDVRIYNCVLDEMDVLDAYNGAAAVKKKVCREDAINGNLDLSGPDGTPDCVINTYDLIELASNWLSCGLYPLNGCEK